MMSKNWETKWMWVVSLMVLVLLVGCANAAPEPEPPETLPVATAVPVEADAAVARDRVLDYIRESANECVPPEGVAWQASTAENQAPEGFDVFRFQAEGCEVTVSSPEVSASSGDKFYHVTLDDSAIGFCWTAVVDENGQIISTGSEALNAPGLANPAATYCEEQGFRYEISTAVDGSQCGQCFFSDAPDDACDAWDFFHGRCGPTP
ncbi:MAG: DUF333 domain-containing protein [Anaerolineales bacterium]|nr:DUF333 domain-containing protein [Anaerolineales bacterium]